MKKEFKDLEEKFALFMDHSDWKPDRLGIQSFVHSLFDMAYTRGKLAGLIATKDGMNRILNIKHEPPINECVQAFLERYESAFLDFSSNWEATKPDMEGEKSFALNNDR